MREKKLMPRTNYEAIRAFFRRDKKNNVVEDQTPKILSGTFRSLVRRFLYTAFDGISIISHIIKNHPEYLGGKLNEVLRAIELPRSEIKNISIWTAEVLSVYNSDLPLLDDRLVILAIYLLDRDVREGLYGLDFVYALINEAILNLKEDPRGYFSEKGKQIWDRLYYSQHDTIPTWTDFPTEIDELGRKAFATALVQRLNWVRKQNDRPNKKTGHFE
jgi:hypothetical protein